MREALCHPLVVGGVVLPWNLLLAPMAGFTDRAFRSICIDRGASLGYTEMVSCEGLIRGHQRTCDLIERAANEKFYAIQIFTGRVETAVASLPFLVSRAPTFLDLNAGCPAPKVTKAGGGVALMREPRKLQEIVRALALKTDLPITVKLRLGWDAETVNYLEVAKRAVDAGAAMVTLHPRTRTQGYGGRADWACLATLKEKLTVPVCGSGDLYTPEDARRLLESTGCDGLLFARGALGNPYLFDRTKRWFQTGDLPPPPSFEKQLEVALEHLRLARQYKGEERAFRELKKHLCAYLRGFEGASGVRTAVVRATSGKEHVAILTSLLDEKKMERGGFSDDLMSSPPRAMGGRMLI